MRGRIFLTLAGLVILLGIFAFIWQATTTPSFKQPQQGPTVTPENQTIGGVPEVVDQALPSVVTIAVRAVSPGMSDPESPFGSIPFLQEEIEANIGSGFIVSEDGLVITNKHVVSLADATYSVVTNEGESYDVESIYRDPLNDLAILQVDAEGLNPVNLGDSSQLQLGEPVVAIGTPLGQFTNTVTSGIISGLGRGIETGSPFQGFVERLDNVIQTDAAINPGNSGGPLLNMQANVIGVNTAVAAGGENLGFAIPSETVVDLLTQFRVEGGTFERPFVGVRYQMVGSEVAALNNIPEGAYVHEVLEGSPADEAGLRSGDIITSLNGRQIRATGEDNLTRIISNLEIGETVPVTVWRDGETVETTITIGVTTL